MMPHRKKRWVATVHYASELGDLDVDYGVDQLDDVHTLIMQGHGYECVRYIEVNRNPHYVETIFTIEDKVRGVTHEQKSESAESEPPSGPKRLGEGA